jgi:AcrR family transcriptional regulator
VRVNNAEKNEISRDAIIGAALAILNREGLSGLTMRGLAEALGIKAASLYWHIRDKEELLTLIAEHITRQIQPASGLGDAKIYLYEVHALFRQKLLETRDAVEVFMRSPPVTPCRVEIIKNVMISLLHLGIQRQNCMLAANMCNNYVLSFAADEIIFRSFPPGASVPFAGILGTGFEPLSFDEQFTRGLDVLFAGFSILK